MNCPRCGKPLAGGASFCMHCGQMLAGMPQPAHSQAMAGAPSYMPTAVAIPSNIRKRNTWLAIGISAALLLLLFFGLRASGVLNLGGKPPDQATLNARGAAMNSTLQARGNGSTPTLQASRVTMPKDVYDWLEHLARCEKQKQILTGDGIRELQQVKAMLGGASGLTTPGDVNNMTDPDYNSFPTLDKVTAVINRLQPHWEQLKETFDSVPPPEECKPIAKAYDTALQNTSELFGQISKSVEGIQLNDQASIKGSADEVRGLGLHHEGGIDERYQETDDLVQHICDKYQTKKWFKIDVHGGGGSLLGF